MRVALAAHDKILRSAIEAQGRFVFSHSGDGMAAAFASPTSAIDAAIDAQRELQLPVRMGIATGEAETRDNDYFGTVLNRAARVMAAGHGGQILVAESTAGLLSGVDLVNLGPRRLRDVPNPIAIFQVGAPGLQSDFPPLRTIDSSHGNLRPAVGRLIGRDADVDGVASAVRSHRLVTLTGVGGVGKTRLAIGVATALADEFPDGVWVFELASVVDPAAVPDAVATVLGITQQQPGMSMSESVAATLEGRIRLLVFDNCEHVLDAAADLIGSILARAATVKVLSTSREGLGLADERLHRVSSLEVDAAVELFAERARTLSPDEARTVEEVCRRLDGIPLAIELAASRLESMTATEVRDRLDHRFKLLTGSRRGLERHQTLRHAVTWSYDLLDDSEKVLLERCSVFAGSFDAQSACAVAGSDDEFSVLELLDALVRKSLLVADLSTGRTRFSMLETIRQFAEEKLVARGDADAASSAHARHFADREAEIMAVWDSPRQREAYTWFATELANLRTAFRWAADHDDLDIAATIATYAGVLGSGMENYEPVSWARQLIEPAVAVEHPSVASLCVFASLSWMTGKPEDGIRYAEAGQVALSSNRNTPPYAMESWLGAAYFPLGEPHRWAELCEAQLKRRGDNHVSIRASRVFALLFSGEVEEAAAAADGLIDAGKATNNPFMRTFAASAATRYQLASADPARNLEACRQELAIAHDTGNSFNASILALNLASLAAHDGVTAEALDHLMLAIRNYHDSGNVASVRSPLAVLGSFLDRLGRFEEAATIIGFSLSPVSSASAPELATTIANLKNVVGSEAYESFVRAGEAMTMAEIAAYAYEQIDQARAKLNADSK